MEDDGKTCVTMVKALADEIERRFKVGQKIAVKYNIREGEPEWHVGTLIRINMGAPTMLYLLVKKGQKESHQCLPIWNIEEVVDVE